MLTTFTNDHLKFLRNLFLLHFYYFATIPYGRLFLMQILSSSPSSVRPISDILVSIGCSSTLLKQP